MYSRTLFRLSFWVITLVAAAAPFSFDSEEIYMTVLSDSIVEIIGDYHFSFDSVETMLPSLLYPFPVDSIAAFPFLVEASVHDSLLTCQEQREMKAVIIPLTRPDTGTTLTVRVRYRQRVARKTATYILMTTHLWKKPLAHTWVTIKLPKKKKLTFTTYPCETKSKEKEWRLYGFRRANFLPECDVVIRWR